MRRRPQWAGVKRAEEEEGQESEGRYREIKGKLMSSVWMCGPGVGVFQGVCVCLCVLLCQPNPPPAHYHPVTQSVCQDGPLRFYPFITARHDAGAWRLRLTALPEQQPDTYPISPLSPLQCQHQPIAVRFLYPPLIE